MYPLDDCSTYEIYAMEITSMSMSIKMEKKYVIINEYNIHSYKIRESFLYVDLNSSEKCFY